jgi:hypothetical protein
VIRDAFSEGISKTMSRKPLGESAMTAAERQRRRRARLRAEYPSRKRGRPLAFNGFGADASDDPSTRRHKQNEEYRGWGKYVLGLLDAHLPDDAKQVKQGDAERFKPLERRKVVLEQIGRHARWLLQKTGDKEGVKADTRELVAELLKQGEFSDEDAVEFFRWVRKDIEAEQRAAPNADAETDRAA